MKKKFFDLYKEKNKVIIKNKFLLKIILSIIFSILLILTVSLAEYSAKKTNYRITIKENTNPIIINKILVNDIEVDLSKNEAYYNNESKNLIINDNNFVFETSKLNNIKFVIQNNTNETIKINNTLLPNSNKIIYNNSQTIIKTISSIFAEKTFIKYLSLFMIFILTLIISFVCINIIHFCLMNIIHKKNVIISIIMSTILLFIIYYFSFYLLLSIFKFTLSMFLFGLLIIFSIKNKELIKNNLESAFVIFAIFAGTTMLYSVPPLNIPDESTHFIKVYDNLFYTQKTNTYISQDYGNCIKIENSLSNFLTKYSYKYSNLSYFEDYSTKLDKTSLQDNCTPNLVYYQKNTAYIPANIFVNIGKFLNLSPYLIYMLGRLSNLLVYIISGYYILKITPKYKRVFLLCYTFPMVLHQSVAIGQDCVNNALFYLLSAYLFKLIFEDKIVTKIDTTILCILTFLLAFCKVIYTPIILLVLLIPKKNFHITQKKLLYKMIIIFFAFLVTLLGYLWSDIIRGNFSLIKETKIVEGARNVYLLSDFIKQPLLFIKIFYNTIMNRLSLDLFRGLFDGFGWHTIWNKDLVLYTLVTLYSLLIFTTEEDIEKNKKNKFIYLFIAILIYILICFSMLFGWTEKGWVSIDGLQPRYFIPVILLLYIFISNKYISIKCKNHNLVLYIGILICNALALFTILTGFYVFV